MFWPSPFGNRTFGLLYAHRFLFGWAGASALSFEYAYLLHCHAPLTIIFLFVASVFLVSGLTALASVTLWRFAGIPTFFLLSMGCSVIASLLIAQAGWSLPLALSSALFSGCAMGLYYPAADMLEAVYVTEDAYRGRQYTFGVSSRALGAAAGAALGGVLIAHYGYLASVLASLCAYLLSLIPIRLLPPHRLPDIAALTPRKTVRYMSGAAFRPFWLVFFGAQLCIIMKLLLPAYLFLKLGGFEEIGFVIAGSIVIEVLLLTLLGGYLDRRGHATGMRHTAWLYATACLAFLATPLSAATALLLNTAQQMTDTLLDSATTTRLHGYLRNHSSAPFMLFGAAWQIALCAWEVVTLAVIAILATFMGAQVFLLLFAGGIAGAFIQYRAFPKKSGFAQVEQQDEYH